MNSLPTSIKNLCDEQVESDISSVINTKLNSNSKVKIVLIAGASYTIASIISAGSIGVKDLLIDSINLFGNDNAATLISSFATPFVGFKNLSFNNIDIEWTINDGTRECSLITSITSLSVVNSNIMVNFDGINQSSHNGHSRIYYQSADKSEEVKFINSSIICNGEAIGSNAYNYKFDVIEITSASSAGCKIVGNNSVFNILGSQTHYHEFMPTTMISGIDYEFNNCEFVKEGAYSPHSLIENITGNLVFKNNTVNYHRNMPTLLNYDDSVGPDVESIVINNFIITGNDVEMGSQSEPCVVNNSEVPNQISDINIVFTRYRS